MRVFGILAGKLERRYFTASGSLADWSAVIDLLCHNFFCFSLNPARSGAELQSDFPGIFRQFLEDCNSRFLRWSMGFLDTWQRYCDN
jgi:hypothetical protein